MLTVLSSRAGDGKTTEVIRRIGASMTAGKRSILIVPDQVTYAAERNICQILSVEGFSLCQVMSFNRFCEAVVRGAGRSCLERLTDSGRMMLLECAILNCRHQLTVFSSASAKSGFAERMERMIALLKSCRITPDALQEMAAAMRPSLLRDKLRDTAVLFQCYEQLLAKGYTDNSDLFAWAAGCAKESTLLQDCELYIDGFDALTGQMLWLVEKLLQRCDILVTVSMDDACPWLYAAQQRTVSGLYVAAQNAEVPVQRAQLGVRTRGNGFDALHTLFARAPEVYKADGGVIDLFIAEDTEAEIRRAAYDIREKLRNGRRLRDFAVACCDTSLLSAVERIFDDYGLPVFCDTARPMQAQPAVQLIFSALETCRAESSSALYGFLSNYLCPIERKDAEKLCSIIRRLGLTPRELLQGVYRGNEETQQELAKLCAGLEPMRVLRSGLAECNSATGFARLVMDFLEDIKLSERLSELIARCVAEGLVSEADEYKQVWDNIGTLLSQLYMLLGDRGCDADTLIRMLRKGFESQNCFVLPSTVDCITVGDIERSRFAGTKELYVLGAADGFFPAQDTGEGLLTAPELQRINRREKVLSPDLEDSALRRNFEVFCILLSPSERLHISYALKKGRVLQRPAAVVNRLCGILVNMPVRSGGAETERLACMQGAMESVASGISAGELSGAQAAALAALRYLRKDIDALFAVPAQEKASRAAELYGNIPISMSRLETQAECPLRNLLCNGLRLKEIQPFQGTNIDVGNVLHNTLERSVPELLALGDAQQPSAMHAIVEKNMYACAAVEHDGVLLHTARARLLCARLKQTITQAVHSITAELTVFTPAGYEIGFGPGRQYPPMPLQTRVGQVLLQGKIDRVDSANIDGQTCLRVVDYKSSAHRLTGASVLDGTTLQLPLYLLAMEKATGAKGAAMYYQDCFSAKAPLLGINEASDPEGFRMVLADAQTTAAGLAADMLTGQAAPMPYCIGKKKICEYCDYAGACPSGITGQCRQASKKGKEDV